MNNLTHFLLDIHSKFVYLATLSSANTMDINTSLKKSWSWAQSDRVRFYNLIVAAPFVIKNYIKLKMYLNAADNQLMIEQQKEGPFQPQLLYLQLQLLLLWQGQNKLMERNFLRLAAWQIQVGLRNQRSNAFIVLLLLFLI